MVLDADAETERHVLMGVARGADMNEVRQVYRAWEWLNARQFFGGPGKTQPRITLQDFVDVRLDATGADAFVSQKALDADNAANEVWGTQIVRLRAERRAAEVEARLKRAEQSDSDPQAIERLRALLAHVRERLKEAQAKEAEAIAKEAAAFDAIRRDREARAREVAEAINVDIMDPLLDNEPDGETDDWALAAYSGDTTHAPSGDEGKDVAGGLPEGYDPDDQHEDEERP